MQALTLNSLLPLLLVLLLSLSSSAQPMHLDASRHRCLRGAPSITPYDASLSAYSANNNATLLQEEVELTVMFDAFYPLQH